MSRRRFVKSLLGSVGLAGLAGPAALPTPKERGESEWLPSYARAQSYRSKKQSSHDPTGGNRDYWSIKSGEQREVFVGSGAGVISHIWFTIAAQSSLHLKELVLRAYWDGLSKPSVETPIGDLFGLNLGDYVIYASAYLACSPGQSLNCYFAMPYRKGARLTVTNEGSRDVGAFYSNIDYLELESLPADALYFHAHSPRCPP